MREKFYPVAGKNYVVLGLGRTGQAAVNWLLEQGAAAIGWDDNANLCNGLASKGFQIVNPLGCDWSEVSALVQSPGITLSHAVTREAIAAGVPIITDLELLQAYAPDAMYIGITGTNGKSTTVSLLQHTLSAGGRSVISGGNIGKAALTLPKLKQDGIYVLELSSYQLELSKTLNMDIAVWLNIAADHLEWHGDIENYVKSKERIFKTSQQLAVIGIDDEYSMMECNARQGQQNVVPISAQGRPAGGVFVAGGFLYDHRKSQGAPIFDMRNIQALAGPHNQQNAAAVYVVATHLGMAPEDVLATFHTFHGLPHRQELVCELGNVAFINDSKGTNPAATAKALQSYKNIYWIAGGQPKDSNWEALESGLPNVKQAFLIGQSMGQMAAFLQGRIPYATSESLDVAVKQAFKQVQIDDCESAVVLLSPACASFDQYKDFEERGDVFRGVVQQLKNTKEQVAHVG